jgi:energy-converting hydrogenase Eha subunit E
MTNISSGIGAILIVLGVVSALINPTNNLPIVFELAGIGFILDGKE